MLLNTILEIAAGVVVVASAGDRTRLPAPVRAIVYFTKSLRCTLVAMAQSGSRQPFTLQLSFTG